MGRSYKLINELEEELLLRSMPLWHEITESGYSSRYERIIPDEKIPVGTHYRQLTVYQVREYLKQVSHALGFVYDSPTKSLRVIKEGEIFSGSGATAHRDIGTNEGSCIGTNYYYNFQTDTLYNYGMGLVILYEQGQWLQR